MIRGLQIRVFGMIGSVDCILLGAVVTCLLNRVQVIGAVREDSWKVNAWCL